MNRVVKRWIVALALSLGCQACLRASDLVFETRSVTVDGEEYGYRVFVPEGWSEEKQWPVILFLHGAGERGSNNRSQLSEGLPEVVMRNAGDFPAVVVLPQCRHRTWWGAPEMEAQAFKALEASMREFNGDPSRVYLTGLSMGGYGTWAFGYKYPDRFAALVPICGGVKAPGFITAPDWHPAAEDAENPYPIAAQGIGDIPVWAFHGALDRRVPVSESRRMVQALEESGGNVKYTEYPNVGHNSWDRAYNEDGLLEWLLSQSNN